VSRSFRGKTSKVAPIFVVVVAITIAVYILRGVGILTFIPGGILLLLILLSIVTGIAYAIEKNKRF